MHPLPAVSQEEELPPELALGDEQGDEESEARTRRGLAEAYERPSPDRPGMSLLQDSLLGLGLQNSGEWGRGCRGRGCREGVQRKAFVLRLLADHTIHTPHYMYIIKVVECVL